VLDDLLPALVGEVEVDVRVLPPFGGAEAFEEEAVLHGVDRAQAEAVEEGGGGGRAPDAADDALALAPVHHLLEDEEVAGEVELADDGQLVLDAGGHFGAGVGVEEGLARLDQADQEGVVRRPLRDAGAGEGVA
jgi:hypothetical protein